LYAGPKTARNILTNLKARIRPEKTIYNSGVYRTRENGRARKDQNCISDSLMRVQIELSPQPGWGTNRAIKASHEIFMHYFIFLKKCYADLCFMCST